MSTDYDYLFKILLIGDSGVGKSSLILRYVDNIYHDSFVATIGVDFKISTIKHENDKIKLQIWDTAGQERFKNITTSFYRGAQGIIMVYDITDRKSYQNIRNWIFEIERYANNSVIKLLIGNKSDLEEHRQIEISEAQEFAKQLNIKFIETSAKKSSNVESAFLTMVKEIKNNLSDFNYVKNDKSKTNVLNGLKESKAINTTQQSNAFNCCNVL